MSITANFLSINRNEGILAPKKDDGILSSVTKGTGRLIVSVTATGVGLVELIASVALTTLAKLATFITTMADSTFDFFYSHLNSITDSLSYIFFGEEEVVEETPEPVQTPVVTPVTPTEKETPSAPVEKTRTERVVTFLNTYKTPILTASIGTIAIAGVYFGNKYSTIHSFLSNLFSSKIITNIN